MVHGGENAERLELQLAPILYIDYTFHVSLKVWWGHFFQGVAQSMLLGNAEGPDCKGENLLLALSILPDQD